MERRKEEAKCPKCPEGQMKMKRAEPLAPGYEKRPMQARCNSCGHEEDYTKVYPTKNFG